MLVANTFRLLVNAVASTAQLNIGNMLVAGLVGTGVPFLLKLLKIDPALASSVIVTTFTDCCGFAFSLGLATLLIKQLLPLTGP